jgi:hypothetical protein
MARMRGAESQAIAVSDGSSRACANPAESEHGEATPQNSNWRTPNRTLGCAACRDDASAAPQSVPGDREGCPRVARTPAMSEDAAHPSRLTTLGAATDPDRLKRSTSLRGLSVSEPATRQDEIAALQVQAGFDNEAERKIRVPGVTPLAIGDREVIGLTHRHACAVGQRQTSETAGSIVCIS